MNPKSGLVFLLATTIAAAPPLPSSMTTALEPAADSAILKSHPALSVTIGEYAYQITRIGNQPTLSVTNGRENFRVALDWAFGHGGTGQTWLFQREGRWYESRVSYFRSIDGLDITPGNQSIPVTSIQQAAGRLISPAETARCFSCHATGVGKSTRLDLSTMTPGIQCQRCHGDAPKALLRTLSAEQTSSLCGECHRTWTDIATNGPQGIQNVRFQPYRLALSKCWDGADSRIKCTTCHDPHVSVETAARAYDAKCQACHTKPARTCRVATKDCVTCHMPRLDLPGAHAAFVDHNIRIVKPGAPYPD